MNTWTLKLLKVNFSGYSLILKEQSRKLKINTVTNEHFCIQPKLSDLFLYLLIPISILKNCYFLKSEGTFYYLKFLGHKF